MASNSPLTPNAATQSPHTPRRRAPRRRHSSRHMRRLRNSQQQSNSSAIRQLNNNNNAIVINNNHSSDSDDSVIDIFTADNDANQHFMDILENENRPHENIAAPDFPDNDQHFIDIVQNENRPYDNIEAPVFPENDQDFMDIIENANRPENHMPHANQSLDCPEFQALRNIFLNRVYNNVSQLTCDTCHETRFVTNVPIEQRCETCKKVQANHINRFTAANNMDPGPAVDVLSCLTLVEQQLIAQINPTMAIFRLPRGGQFGFRGHVINFPQNVNNFVRNLPRRLDQLDILVIRRGNNQPDLPANLFTVNRQRVHAALLWLKEHNCYYRADNIQIDQQNLDALPVNAVVDLPEQNIMQEVDEDIDQQNANNDQPLHPNQANNNAPIPLPQNGHNNVIPNTFAPAQRPQPHEIQAIQAAIDNHEVIDWPARDNEPVNEFRHVGYIARAFPCLFPSGNADLRAPRDQRIFPREYFTHLLYYKDGRFQADPRFVFFSYNSILRWEALQIGRVYVNNNPNERQMSVADIRELLAQDQRNISTKILRFGSQIRGTAQYWYKRGREIMAMNEQLGSATVFFTFSVADMQWPDLARFLNTENRTIAQAIAHSPLTVDTYVDVRFNLFFTHFLKPYLDIVDYWYRFEWQNRGSFHVHGLAWLRDPPDSQTSTEIELSTYWDKYVSTWNTAIQPNENPVNFHWPVNNHPCSTIPQQVQNLHDYLKDLINICQKHTRCTPGYCLRTQRDGTQKCRFGFPKQIQPQTTLNFDLDDAGRRKNLDFTSARNDPLLNNYNTRCMVTWAANHDISITFDISKAARYIAKYASKAETASIDYTKVYRQLVTHDLPPEANIQRTATALLLNTIARDVCAQEAVHIVTSLDLYKSSRNFVTLKVDGQTIQDNFPGQYRSDMRKYMARPAASHDMSFFDISKSFMLVESRANGNIRLVPRRGGDAILQIFPQYSSDRNAATYSKYCMQYLILHKPFTQWNQLLQGFASPLDAYAHFIALNPVANNIQHEQLENAVQHAADQLLEERDNIPPNPPDELDQWMLLLRQEDNLPLDQQPAIQPRPNFDFEWVASSRDLIHLAPHAATFLIDSRNNNDNELANGIPPVNVGLLNNEQQQIYDLVANHFQNPHLPPLKTLVLGSAGTGKSFLIHALNQLLGHNCQLLAPTGVAAVNISGSTIHSFLQFAKTNNQDFRGLHGPALHNLQAKCSNIKYIIIDELSMIGCRLLNAIDQRLKQAFPDKSDQSFGGCSILMFGDFGQLPPVGDSRMFKPSRNSVTSLQGNAAYLRFNNVFFLTHCVRQQNDHAFRDLLLRLRDATSTNQDYELLSQRFFGIAQNDADFNAATRLFPTRELVRDYNSNRLYQLQNPVAQVDSNHDGRDAHLASSNIACGLERTLFLAVGATVMLRVNLWVERGLVNGSIGTVFRIIFAENQGPPSLPAFVICIFPNYTGPPFLPDQPHSFPVIPIRRSWSAGNHILSRTGIPLDLAWALTIHKSQGLTMPKAVIDIGDKEQTAGISFVALSRVKNIGDLLLQNFPMQRLRDVANNLQIAQRKQEETRLRAL